ncbi:DNA repair protein RecO [Hydrogenophaga sp. 5NK40-0174]|uniref:DNA repair protein RecO n=1 Tax=Hydrogenophaga sp. 5NK40-0174 TaxID=3127649 RepID=UPI0031057570
MATRRTSEEPAFVLHRYDWSETSLVLEVFSRHQGRIALVAKGVKRPTSQYRSVLLPLQPLAISWSGDAEVRTLKSAQWQGGHVMPTGEALMAGAYLNELLMRLLARDDPHQSLFDHYAMAVSLLADNPEAQPAILRAFELVLLKDVGLLPDLTVEGQSLAPLGDDEMYQLMPEGGLTLAMEGEPQALRGSRWKALADAMSDAAPFVSCMLASGPVVASLRHQVSRMLHYHCGVRHFKTRQLMLDVQAMSRPRQSTEGD